MNGARLNRAGRVGNERNGEAVEQRKDHPLRQALPVRPGNERGSDLKLAGAKHQHAGCHDGHVAPADIPSDEADEQRYAQKD
jgi:hypothetical protein